MVSFFKKPIQHFLHRHPVFYYLRYPLISKNYKEKCSNNIGCYNDTNDLKDIPKLFFEVNSKIQLNSESDEFEKALAIATYLRLNFKGGPGLSLSSHKTLEKMMAGEGGVCSDFSQIFCIFCFINNIKVKEWHCVDRLYKPHFGHTFNEIYSSKLKKWIAIDAHKSIYFIDDDNNPLSSVALFTHLREGNILKFITFSSYVLKKIERIPLVYSKITIPYIIVNYNTKKADYHLDKYHKKFTSFIIYTISIIRRKNHNFLFVMDNYKKLLIPDFQKH